MDKPIIEVKGLSKRYTISHEQGIGQYKTFRDTVMDTVKAPFRFIGGGLPSSTKESFWALKDVSFDVEEGEVVGIIGRNGAGKTTLLKILSKITPPTEGRAVLRGRVSSLLEVGTGFHPELSGRENIYLNGAILGMTRREIDDKFDDIVKFSEIEKFLDTPVKRYSSGMYVRLAFAVAAHLDPEILLVDEVLAVGDAQFQKKCLGKMKEVSEAGRTVLFVSHNMDAIRRLCPRALLIADGRIQSDGSSDTIIGSYLLGGREEESGIRVYDDATAPGDDYVRLRSIRLVNPAGQISSVFKIDECMSVEIEYEVLQQISDFYTHIRVLTQGGIIVFGSGGWDDESVEISNHLPGRYLARCVIPNNLLNQGSYSLTVTGAIPNVRYVFVEENVLTWKISDIGGAGGAISTRPGIIRPLLKWGVSVVDNKVRN